ncbi:Trafficking protein particle complex subunit 2-like protein [Vitis vinifera]|uniref:Trafficking protein particle complex subunit 2-like protein n=1 Tax=Vitis vinifera TaxID=29760 RepID=A0A438DSU1_VITVI|nr:Trafficking protein particle complex subunit 2-like protein [Vitis vinifera]
MIVCVAVVGHQNNPLYIQSFTEADDALKLHHIVHCSLDVVDERGFVTWDDLVSGEI